MAGGRLAPWLSGLLCALRAVGIPQFLPCGSDSGTQMRIGQTIMGQPVGAFGPGNLSISITNGAITHGAAALAKYAPGEELLVRLGGFPANAFFAVRVSDGGARLGSAPGRRPLINRCDGQLYPADRAAEGLPEFAVLSTPCDGAPDVITLSLVSAPSGHGPFYFTTAAVRRVAGRAASCPPSPPPAPRPYPFQVPLNDTCPNGAAAQHNAPCPKVPCLSPAGKEGTCLVSSDQSLPATNGTINAEARVELLTDDVTPISHHYVTGSKATPRAWAQDLRGWQLLIDGEVATPTNFTMEDLQRFPHVTRRYVLECAGNWGRGLVPADQQADWWSIGAVGCSEWTGVLLRDVLEHVGVKSTAVYVGYYGEDDFLSRGVPVEKALDGHTMLAWAMNGVALPAWHGFPLRMLAPGYPGSAQGKWLKRLWIRDREHDGLGMLGKSYRIPTQPIRPGDYTAPDSLFKVFTQQPVRSLIVRPARCTVVRDRRVRMEGKAWSGAGDVVQVSVSHDAGLTWIDAELSPPANKWAWQKWTLNLTLPGPGVWNIFARATDHTGAIQPMLVPAWNPGGYGNNQAMKVDVTVLDSEVAQLSQQQQQPSHQLTSSYADATASPRAVGQQPGVGGTWSHAAAFAAGALSSAAAAAAALAASRRATASPAGYSVLG